MCRKKTNRWLIWIFVVLAIVALLGFSLGALYEGILASNPSPSPTPITTATTSSATPAVPDTRKKELQDLESGYLQILQAEPNNQDALEGLVDTRSQMVTLKLKPLTEVIDPLEKLVKLYPTEPQYRLLLAQTQQRTGNQEAADENYRTLLAAASPGNLDVLQGYISSLVQQKRQDVAITLLETTLKNAPQANQIKPNSIDTVAVQLLLGQVYTSQKQYDQAVSLYDQLIAVNAQDFRPVYGKAIALRQQGKAQEANSLFQTAEKLAPDDFKPQIKAVASSPPSATVSPSASPTAKP
ncbi:MAG: tetratricopeptide repeat protein [Acaryochloridaceae cyanobacterium SU_2_1]|nr:tetratricopeptide repeat protein [Acaryochloridaceae cyanobacterium SU_2_1]